MKPVINLHQVSSHDDSWEKNLLEEELEVT